MPEEQRYFQKVYNTIESIADFYNFTKIETPILEETALFEKGTGFSTDVVQKQMFNLKTKGGDSLTLRPEFTPGIARAYIQHGMFNLPQPVKFWHFGPAFRYEHHQAGRLRQFWQFGFETLGEKSPVIDSQVIQLFYNVLKELKLTSSYSQPESVKSGGGLIVEINSIGDNQCRPYYKKLLVNYLRAREQSLCGDCRRRLRENPLRILDCKEEKCQPIKSQAPQIIDHLCEECHNHFKEVLEFLDEIELPYSLNPYLVRGLDYYTKTVFEISEQSLDGNKRGSLVGGGRYDALVKLLGGKDTPACGGAAGIERIIDAMKDRGLKFAQVPPAKIYLAQLGNLAKRKSLKLIEDFRKQKISVVESFGRDSLKAQLSRANRMDVKHTLILGQREALDGTIIIRDMASGKQETIRLDKIVREMQKRLKK